MTRFMGNLARLLSRQQDAGTYRGRPVLVTGASSGLGQACAAALSEAGFQVLAGIRSAQDGERLVREVQSNGQVRPVQIDVTDESGVRDAAQEVERLTGGLWALVNNAGICVPSPVECLPLDQLRNQLEVNLVGQVAVTQAFLPQIRAARGRIVNVTSGLGRIALPYLGAYAMSQFAKEALSDVLRRELAAHNVRVSVVEPGAITTPIWHKLGDIADEVLASAPDESIRPYRETFQQFAAAVAAGAQQSQTAPAEFGAVVLRALTDVRPRTRYQVGKDARSAALFSRFLPDTVIDKKFS